MISGEQREFQWWKEKENAWKPLFAWVNEWDTKHAGVASSHVRNMRLYSNREVYKLSMAQYTLSSSADPLLANSAASLWTKPSRLSLNVAKACVDTMLSKIGKNKIKPMFLTTGGTLELRTRAQNLNKFLFGALWEAGAYEVMPLVLRDAFIFGDGFCKVLRENGRVKFERILPDEILIDPIDGYYGCPRMMTHRRFVSRETLIGMFPKYERDIRATKSATVAGYKGYSDAIVVAESWWLGDEAAPGKHIIAIDGTTLFEEDYAAQSFPIRRFSYTPAPVGYWGSGIIEEITGIQIEINRLLLFIQEAQRMISHPRIWLEYGSKVNPRHIVNETGSIGYYAGQPPIFQAAQAVQPEVYNHLWQLYSKAFEICGISALSATSQKPAGLNSGKALEEYNDIETERFARTAQSWADFWIEMSYAIIDEIKKTPNYIVSSHSKDNGIEKLKWSDIALPRDSYVIQCFDTSAFPKTPAGRLAYIERLMQAGLIDPTMGQELLDFPDLEAYNRFFTGPLKLAFAVVEKALFQGEYIAPEPFFDLDTLQKVAQQAYSWALTVENIPEKNLDLLRKMIDEVLALKPPPPAPTLPMPEMPQLPMPVPA